jgi:hypothetical protein
MDRAFVLSGVRRVVSFGWPRDFPLVQFPNLPLVVAFATGQAASMLHDIGHSGAGAAAYAAMLVWAYEELVDGVNWFRHLLGLVYVISTIAHVALALGH